MNDKVAADEIGIAAAPHRLEFRPEPIEFQDRRPVTSSTWAAAAVSVSLHALVLTGLLWYSPPAVFKAAEEIIPVEIIVVPTTDEPDVISGAPELISAPEAEPKRAAPEKAEPVPAEAPVPEERADAFTQHSTPVRADPTLLPQTPEPEPQPQPEETVVHAPSVAETAPSIPEPPRKALRPVSRAATAKNLTTALRLPRPTRQAEAKRLARLTAEPHRKSEPRGKPTTNPVASKSASRQGRAQQAPSRPVTARADGTAYRSAIYSRVQAARRYPESARLSEIEGSALVNFFIDTAGRLVGVAMIKSSGRSVLDQEALASIRRASPFPPPPPGIDRAFSVRLTFRMP